MEIFNEVILMVVMYTIICFSPLVPDVEVRFNIGYICMIAISSHLVVNLYIIGRSQFFKLKLMMRIKLARRKYLK